MTLVLALPATDGVAILTDTRKWWRDGSYIDGHRKLVSCRGGLLTGAGSGQLLDLVAIHARRRTQPEVVSLIARVAASGTWQGEEAEWTLTIEGRSADGVRTQDSLRFIVFDGFRFKSTGWVAGSLPSGLPAPFIERTKAQLTPIIDKGGCLEEIRAISVQVCSDLYESGLISPDFDFGTHRPGGRVSIQRMVIPGARSKSETRKRV